MGHLIQIAKLLPVFVGVILVWAAALLMVMLAQGRLLIWLAAPLVGAGLAGAWTVSRPLLLTLIPEEEAATFFGFNAWAGRFAAILGLLVWSGILRAFQDTGAFRYRLALGAMLGFVLISLVTVFFIPRKPK